MACSSGKIEHPTRDEALTHVRELEYKNSLRGDDLESVGLSAYPCRECGHYHVGRRYIPTVWHYDTGDVLDAMTDAIALTPAKPHLMSKRMRREYTGRMLMLFRCCEERAPMVWFTWNEAWDFSDAPHPGVFVERPVAERAGEGVVRIGVPASVITLSWRDYVQRNATLPLMRNIMTDARRPSDWLATEQPVPFRLVRSMEAWYRGRWVNAAELPDDFDDWLAEPLV